jgi:hypothetical protein
MLHCTLQDIVASLSKLTLEEDRKTPVKGVMATTDHMVCSMLCTT